MSEPYLLLVESNQDDLFLTRRTLRLNGVAVRVESVIDGVEALSLLHNASELPLAVLIDCRLPRMNGELLVSRLRENERTEDLPILLLTGSLGDVKKLCGEHASCTREADAFLTKPLDWRAFRQAAGDLGLLERLVPIDRDQYCVST